MPKIDPTDKPALERILADRRSQLRQLILQSESLTSIQSKVAPHIPPELQEHVVVCGVKDQALLLITDSGVWATRLRQLSDQIISALARSAPELAIRSFAIKVRPRAMMRKARRQAIPISKENARLLIQEAEQTEDEGLKRVLQSLARHTADDP